MSDETVFREVDEALRRDRLNSAWRRFGPYVIGVAVLIVLLVAANEGWNWWQDNNASHSSDELYAAFDAESAGKTADAMKSLDAVIAQGSGQYPALARFKQASLLAKQGDKDKALAAYDELSTTAPNQQLKEIALLLGAEVLVDKGDVAGVKQRVQGLAAPDNPLHNSALETLGLAQYKAGDLDGARNSFNAILSDPAATSEARARVQIYLGQLTAQGAGIPPVAANPAGAAAPAAGDNAAAAANDNAAPATDGAAATGVESSQPATPDAALDLAVPSAPAASTDGAPAAATAVPGVLSEPSAPADDSGTSAAAGTTTAPAGMTAPSSDAATPAAGASAPPSGAAGQ